MPEVQGLGEAALHVEDPGRSARFYQDIFGFRKIKGDDRFVALRITSAQVLLLFRKGGTLEPVRVPGGVIPPHDGEGRLHLAFTISAADWNPWQEHLRARGVAIESVVNWGPGLRSLYFRDPDEHLVELATPGLWNAE